VTVVSGTITDIREYEELTSQRDDTEDWIAVHSYHTRRGGQSLEERMEEMAHEIGYLPPSGRRPTIHEYREWRDRKRREASPFLPKLW